MEGEEADHQKKEVDSLIMDKVGGLIHSIRDAKHVDQLIVSLHSLALLLFPLDSTAISGSIDKRYRDEVLSAKVPSMEERQNWWQVFYGGASFPTLSRLLLYDIASNWLACFPISAKKHVYDVFFVRGRTTEVVQTLVSCLQHSANDKIGNRAICSNAERLIILCLLENGGVLKMAQEFSDSCQLGHIQNEQRKQAIPRVAQLVTSIPDKARMGAPKSLSSHLFFKQITVQLLAAVEEDKGFCNGTATLHITEIDGGIAFVGEAFSRICRRGSADVLSSEMAPRILKYVQSFVLSKPDMIVSEEFELMPGSGFWSKIIEAMKDPYAVERMSEQLLHCLATHNISDAEAYWILWVLFHRCYELQTSIRSIFVEKFLFWKVFPVCCLRWILQFSVLECPPDATSLTEGYNKRGLMGTVQKLVEVWSKQEFVQSASIEQQAYVTAAVGLSLEYLSKEDLDSTKGAMHSILQGVSCRLESPSHMVRKMASCVALLFSKIIDPNNPLYLDDLCPEEIIDWEFGIVKSEKSTLVTSSGMRTVAGCGTTLVPEKELKNTSGIGMVKNTSKDVKEKNSEFNLIDPDEVIDPALLNKELISEEDNFDDDTENSETLSNSSLQPYDLTDDDTDLTRNFTQLVDVVGALRKSDDADGIERALDVAEKLIRASPDELKYVAGDLSRTLVQVRCFDSTVEGEEESAEEKRQQALVALIVTSPLECLDTLNKLLYSPNIDVSQRIMILDVMTEAAQELANATTTKPKALSRAQISTVSETQPWFMPSSIGPPGVGPWREIPGNETPLNWSYSYERTLPSALGQINKGKTRRWGLRSRKHELQLESSSQNSFPRYAAAFMLPAMQGFDKKKHGVDLLGRDFLVLGRLVYMLGVCIKCAAMHPEASALALPLLDMLSSRHLCHHAEAYVRRSVLFAASCILVALHPSYVASSLVEGNPEISKGLEWIRTWALSVTELDSDRECYTERPARVYYRIKRVVELCRPFTMAMVCLQLHAEMALQASRAIESAENTSKAHSIGVPSSLTKETIKIPYSNSIKLL